MHFKNDLLCFSKLLIKYYHHNIRINCLKYVVHLMIYLNNCENCLIKFKNCSEFYYVLHGKKKLR